MKTIFAAALAATVLLAACERAPQPRTTAPDAGSGPSVPTRPEPQTSSAPTHEQKKEGANPQQGQVDPKQAEQHRDFKQPGDQAGPKSADTQPTK